MPVIVCAGTPGREAEGYGAREAEGYGAREAHEAHEAHEARKAHEPREADEARRADMVRKARKARKAHEPREADETHEADEAHDADVVRKADGPREAHATRKPRATREPHQPPAPRSSFARDPRRGVRLGPVAVVLRPRALLVGAASVLALFALCAVALFTGSFDVPRTRVSEPSPLSAHAVTGGYGKRTVIGDLSLEIPRGRGTTVIGANGCGKSTLLRVLARLLPPSSGRVLLDGEPMDGLRPRARARKLTALPQNPWRPRA